MKTSSKKNNSSHPPKEKTRRDFFHRPVKLPPINLYSIQKWSLIGLLSFVLSIIIFSSVPSPSFNYTLGQVALQDIKAPQDFLVEDQPSTAKKKQQAIEEVLPVYDFDLNLIKEIENKLNSTFNSLSKPAGEDSGEVAHQQKISKEEFEELLGISISDSCFAFLEKKNFAPEVINYIYQILGPILEQKIVSNRELLKPEKDRGIVIRYFPTGEETVFKDFFQVLDLEQARLKVREVALTVIPSGMKDGVKPIVEIAQALLKPNLTFNKRETEERKIAAAAAVKPVLFEIKKGEMIVREGEKITSEHLIKLNKLSQLKTDQRPFFNVLSNFLLIFVIIAVIFSFFLSAKEVKLKRWNQDLFFISIMLIIITLMMRIGSAMPKPEALFLSEDALLFVLPVALGAIVISVVKGIKPAAIFSVLVAIFSLLLTGDKIEYFFYFLLGSLIGAKEAVSCNQRTTLLKAGFKVGLANLLVIFCLKIKGGGWGEWQPLIGDLALGFLGGVLSGIIATGVVPLIEVLFDYTTDIKLLELGNLNHPLLKELVVQAPGTYHHSILTGSLVEAAAESIGANPLLAKVGAYYHDIGKMSKPLYFIENQKGGENKHDKLSPNMSSLILISHIKEGVELAKEYRLGKVITDIIQQHHGTSLISFFFQKAKEKENTEEAVVDEKDFRYPGPKPQTKEAGLVMLADAVEAASRTLNDPTPARVQGMVQRIINSFFTDGQLDECELTLKDLNQIAKSFNRIINGIFHQRIEYPSKTLSVPIYPKKYEALDYESPKETKDKLKNGEEGGERDLKRLGIS